LALLPLELSLPEALVTAELGSAAFQCSSGGVIWVPYRPRLERLLGAITGYFNWISGATDNAIYPALFLTYIAGNGGNSKYVGWVQVLVLVLVLVGFLSSRSAHFHVLPGAGVLPSTQDTQRKGAAAQAQYRWYGRYCLDELLIDVSSTHISVDTLGERPQVQRTRLGLWKLHLP
jgi:hypothetical protein